MSDLQPASTKRHPFSLSLFFFFTGAPPTSSLIHDRLFENGSSLAPAARTASLCPSNPPFCSRSDWPAKLSLLLLWKAFQSASWEATSFSRSLLSSFSTSRALSLLSLVLLCQFSLLSLTSGSPSGEIVDMTVVGRCRLLHLWVQRRTTLSAHVAKIRPCRSLLPTASSCGFSDLSCGARCPFCAADLHFLADSAQIRPFLDPLTIRQCPATLGTGYVGLALGAFGSRISPHSLPLGVMVANMLQALFWAWFLAKSIQLVPT